MFNKPAKVKIYAKDWGYTILIDMGVSIVAATDISFFVRNTENVASKITTNITIYNNNYFKWIVPENTTDTPGTYYIRPHFTLEGWTGSGKVVSFDVEAVDDTTPAV